MSGPTEVPDFTSDLCLLAAIYLVADVDLDTNRVPTVLEFLAVGDEVKPRVHQLIEQGLAYEDSVNLAHNTFRVYLTPLGKRTIFFNADFLLSRLPVTDVPPEGQAQIRKLLSGGTWGPPPSLTSSEKKEAEDALIERIEQLVTLVERNNKPIEKGAEVVQFIGELKASAVMLSAGFYDVPVVRNLITRSLNFLSKKLSDKIIGKACDVAMGSALTLFGIRMIG